MSISRSGKSSFVPASTFAGSVDLESMRKMSTKIQETMIASGGKIVGKDRNKDGSSILYFG